MRCHHLLVALAALPLIACGTKDDSVGIPQPEPLPLVTSMRHSPANEGQVFQGYLLGLPGTCAGVGQVLVTGSQGTFHGEATVDGSFVLSLLARAGETIEVRFKTSEPAGYTLAPLSCPVSRCSPMPSPQPRSGVTPITSPASGQVTIRGESGSTATIIAANERSGQVTTTMSGADGYFEITIAASTADVIHLFQDRVPLSDKWTLTVP